MGAFPVVRFLPDEREAPLDRSRSLLDHARRAGVSLISPCGGRGACRKCRVAVGGRELLACRCLPGAPGSVEVEVPESSRPARLIPFLSGEETAGSGPFEPRPAPEGMARPLGVALDMGTWTLAGILLDLADGRILSRAAEDNPLVRLGDDVISLILHAEGSPGGLFRLQETLLQGVDSLITALLRGAGNPGGEVREVAVASNTALSHFLHGIDPSLLRRPPYTPSTLVFPERTGTQLGSSAARSARWRTFPALGGFVGGDIVAGLVACGIPRSVEPGLYFDLGTNGEVVLGSRDFVIACFSSSGPALEGGEVGCGSRAVSGAIDWVRIPDPGSPPQWSARGGGKPVGLCGSGIVDLVSELFRVGVLDRAGRLVRRPEAAPLRETRHGPAFVVADERATASGEPLLLTEADVGAVLKAKASLYAAGEALIGAVGIARHAVRKVFIAGGFGDFLDLRSATRLGVFPPAPLRRFVPLGNASLAGALSVLRAPSRWLEAAALAHAATYHDLSSDPRFTSSYQGALFIPHAEPEPFQRILAEEDLPC